MIKIIKICFVFILLLSSFFIVACEDKKNTSSDTSISVVKECEEEYQKYLKSFINFEETGDLVFDEEKQLDSEYVVGEKIILPNLESPNGNEKIFIQQKEGSNISLYKSFEPLQKNDSVTFDKKGDYIVCFVQENQDGTVYNKNFNLTIKTAPKFDLSAFPKTIGINEEIKFEKIYFFNDGETKIANINCINPVGNGISLLNGIFKPDIIGQYKFTVSAENDKYIEKFTVDVVGDTSKLFISDIVEAYENYPLPDWSIQGSGTLLKTSTTGVTARYCNVVDLSKISSDTPIVEFQVMFGDDGNYTFADIGSKWGYSKDFFRIKLTDIYDSTKNIEFGWRSDEWYYYSYASKGDSFIVTAPCDSDMEKWYTANGNVEMGHYTFRGSEGISSNAQLFNIAYDYEKNISYYFNNNSKKFFSDYSESDQWGGYAFDKFTTGEVYIDIEFGYFDGIAGVVITSIAGNSLSGENITDLNNIENNMFVDKVQPIIKIDLCDEYLENMPFGYVNHLYPIPKAYAFDTISGKCNVNIGVVNKKNNKVYSVSNGYFIPQEEGDYQIIYTTIDGFANYVKKILTVKVWDETIPLISFSFEDLQPAKTGMRYKLPNIVTHGGSGNIEYSYKLIYNGIEVSADKSNRLLLDKSGELKFIFDANDYLGTEIANNELVINVQTTNEVFIEVSDFVPLYARKGTIITLPDFNAVCYAGEIKNRYIEVNGNRLSNDRTYNITESKNSILKVDYIAETEELFKVSYDILVLDEYINVESAFVTENVSNVSLNKKYEDGGLKFSVGGVSTIKSPNPVLSTEFSIMYDFDIMKTSSVKITLVDCFDESNKVSFNIKKSSKEEKVCLCLNEKISYDISPYQVDGNIVKIYFSFDSSSGRVANFKNILYAYVTEGVLTNYFNGFTNNICYVEIEVSNNSLTDFNLYSLCNQTFGKYSNDIAFGPQIAFDKKISSKDVKKGETIIIPSAKGYDLFDGVCNVIVSVTTSNGEFILRNKPCTQEYSIVVDKTTVYTVKYSSSDSSFGNSSISIVFNSIDLEPPRINVDFENTNLKVNSSIKIQSASVEDNITKNIKYYVYMIASDNRYIEVDVGSTYVFAKADKYKLVYIAMDSAGNIGRKEIIINVA